MIYQVLRLTQSPTYHSIVLNSFTSSSSIKYSPYARSTLSSQSPVSSNTFTSLITQLLDYNSEHEHASNTLTHCVHTGPHYYTLLQFSSIYIQWLRYQSVLHIVTCHASSLSHLHSCVKARIRSPTLTSLSTIPRLSDSVSTHIAFSPARLNTVISSVVFLYRRATSSTLFIKSLRSIRSRSIYILTISLVLLSVHHGLKSWFLLD